jgi:ribonuclease T2
MTRRLRHVAILAALLVGISLGAAAGDTGSAGQFDYYLLSLSWSPQYCARPEARDDRLQCEGHNYGFVLHGLWPQYRRGSAQFCTSTEPRRVKPQIVDEMLPIMVSPELIEHEWQRHGTCSGLAQEQYFAAARQAFAAFRAPREFDEGRLVATDRRTIFSKLRESNPQIPGGAITLRCQGNDFSELRICLSKELRPIACGPGVRGNCPRDKVQVSPIR